MGCRTDGIYLMDAIRKWLLGGGLALLSAFLFGLADITVKASSELLTVWHMLVGRGVISAVLIYAVARRMGIDIRGKNPKAMLLIGAVNVAAVICLMIAIFNLPIFEALVLLYLYPALAALLSSRLLKEYTPPLAWFFIALAFGGTVLILWPQGAGIVLSWGHLAGLAAAFLMALAFTLIRRHSKGHHPFAPVFYFALISLAVGALPLGLQKAPLWPGWEGLGWLLAMSLLAALAQFVVYKSLNVITAAQAGSLSMSEVVWGSVWGYLIFSEALGALDILGAVLVLGGGICLNLGLGEGKK